MSPSTSIPAALSSAVGLVSMRLRLSPAATSSDALFARIGPPVPEDIEAAYRLSAEDVTQFIRERTFINALLTMLEQDPIEDGVRHPAEAMLADAISIENNGGQWVQSAYADVRVERPAVVAGILRCLGRLAPEMVGDWGQALVLDGLSHPDVQVRDASVCAFELWEPMNASAILQPYVECEPIPWLQHYMRHIIALHS